jgi:formate hydrogenlyase subunit 6/NADH:ubiquinone oxidoreductase subunit I
MRAQPRPSRRRFLNPFDSSKPPVSARFAPAPAPDRVVTLEILTRLSTQYGGVVSEKLYHRVQVDERCQGHAVCAAGCPTGALRLEHDEGNAVGLSHSSQLCIACGHCERVCPENALRLERGAGHAPRQWVARFQTGECTVCGTQMRQSPRGARAVCQSCEKAAVLARSAFNQFYRREL